MLAAGLGACVFALAASGGASASPAPNGYTNVTKVYSSAGCTIWPVPGELAGDVTVTAIGAAGATGPTNGAGGGGGAGGDGDEIVGTLTGFESPTQSLDVCVDYGGGSGGTAASATDDGGDGGGASGVSYGTDFTEPFIVAGGGGGGGSGALGGPGGSVGDAGTGAPAQAGPGGGASDFSFGPGGGGLSSNGTAGAKFNAAGPGQGGNGANTTNGATFGAGGGGGGYYGGGGGGSGSTAGAGGGGGSDFCSPYGAYSIDVMVSGCTTTAGAGTANTAGTATGDAEVILQYEIFTGFSTSISTAVYDATTTQAWSANGEPGSDGAYDTATLTGAPYNHFPVDGSVTYDLYANGTCSNTPASTQTVNVNSDGTVPNSSSTGTLSPGSYSFQATYNGGSYYAASAPGTCEPFTVNPTTVATSLTAFPQLDFVDPPISVGEFWVGARLTAAGVGVSGQTITFSAGHRVLCTAQTNSSGFAHCRINPVQEVLVLLGGSYQASFTANANYLTSSASTPTVVLFPPSRRGKRLRAVERVAAALRRLR